MDLNPKWTLKRFLHALYGVYVLVAFVLLALSAFALVILPFTLGARRQIGRGCARLFFRAVGIQLVVADAQHLPMSPCVVVANHASYVDGVVLEAVLPAHFCFVIKKEVMTVPIAGLLLRRIGSEFVDRFNRHAGGLDARRLIKSAEAGGSLVFFPEGTFLRHPGVGKFHTGAFAIAARAGLPIAPIAISGTRQILPGGHVLPRPGRVHVQVLPAVAPISTAHPSEATSTLRSQARSKIVAALGEPDLSENDGVAALEAARRG
jgi:1-acyl-sn-glycerol-3-phosphate acyltransferase